SHALRGTRKAPMLDPELRRLWVEHLTAEKDQVRDAKMPLLGRFIDQLLSRGPDTWRRWAKQTAAAVADGDSTVRVSPPLFRRVFLPALAEGIRNQEPGCARWLAHFETLLRNTTESDLPA